MINYTQTSNKRNANTRQKIQCIHIKKNGKYTQYANFGIQ